jgi:hypothetical protein
MSTHAEVLQKRIRGYVEGERAKWARLRADLSVAECDEELAAIDAAMLALREIARRDAIWKANRNEPMCAYGCESPTFMEAAIACGWRGGLPRSADELVVYETAQNAGWLAHVATCPNHPQRKVEAERDQLLSALRYANDQLAMAERSELKCTCGATQQTLAGWRAQGLFTDEPNGKSRAHSLLIPCTEVGP